MVRKLVIIALVWTLVGCASAYQKRTITIGEVTKDIDVRIIGSYTQQNDPGRAADLGANVPIEGVPVDVKALIESQGVEQSVSMDIGKVGGTFRLEVIGTGIQNGRSIEIKTDKEQVLIGELEAQLSK